jgi:ADP-ribose pyrophosphatase YjhB (NUDIX family)
VGVVVHNPKGEVLLIERARWPWGWAPPSGHVDQDVDGAGQPLWRASAVREVQEEVGLELEEGALVRLGGGQKANMCRREDGDWHEWMIFEASSRGEVVLEMSEAKRWQWASQDQIRGLAARTGEWEAGEVEDGAWQDSPGLQEVWVQWFSELGVGGLGDGRGDLGRGGP